MIDNGQAEMPMSKCLCDIPRTNSEIICEVADERRGVSWRLERLKKAIEADPEGVSAGHKELWRKQAKAMQKYVDILGERIIDLINTDNRRYTMACGGKKTGGKKPPKK